jgi:hypothetical protein
MTMISNKEFGKILDLDLEPIKTKLMHRASGEGWSRQQADAVEIEYRRFLYLMKAYPDEQTAPSVEVDTFWHYHILDTMKYAADCAHAFGYFLHHYPYLGMGEDDPAAREQAGARMAARYETTFGERYGRAATPNDAFCAVTAKAAFCAATANTAFCAVTAKTAFCAVTVTTSFCAVTAPPAFCAVAAGPADGTLRQ